MSEINSFEIEIQFTGTLEQINRFRDLLQHQKTLTNFRYLDGYAQARAYKYLPDELRNEEVFESLICDKYEAFAYIFYADLQNNPDALDAQIMKIFESLPENDKCKAFKFLSAKNRTFANLLKIPEKDRAFAFEYLNKNEKIAENWLRLP